METIQSRMGREMGIADKVLLDRIKILESGRTASLAAIEKAETDLRRIDSQLGLLREVHDNILAETRRLKPTPPERNGAEPKRPGPSDAIMAYIREHDGATLREMIDAIAGEIETSSSNPRRLLDSLTRQLIERGKLRRDDAKRLWLTEHSNLEKQKGE